MINNKGNDRGLEKIYRIGDTQRWRRLWQESQKMGTGSYILSTA